MNTDEYGRIILPDGTGGYAMNRGGWVEVMVRANSISAWETAGESRNLLKRVTLDDGSEKLVPAGSDIHIHGPFYPTITKASLDEEGNVITPATIDDRPHYNLRIGPWTQETLASDGVTPRWYETLIIFMEGTPITDTDKNKTEEGVKRYDITLLDPLTVHTPQIVFA